MERKEEFQTFIRYKTSFRDVAVNGLQREIILQ